MQELFPNLKKVQDVQKLWDGLSGIYKLLLSTKKMDEAEIDDFTTKATNWVDLFTSAYHTKNINHIICDRIWENQPLCHT